MLFAASNVAALILYYSNKHHGDSIDDLRWLNGLPSIVDTRKTLIATRRAVSIYIVIRGIHDGILLFNCLLAWLCDCMQNIRVCEIVGNSDR